MRRARLVEPSSFCAHAPHSEQAVFYMPCATSSALVPSSTKNSS
jgi:hypothetical protein